MRTYLKDIDECVKKLKKGDLILYPTDTIWGVGCDATNEKAVQKIYQLKKRSDEKAMIVLVADEKEVTDHVKAFDHSLTDYLKKIKKPTTVIYNDATGFANNLIAKDGSIAIRICKDDFCSSLIKEFGKPIVSTSANISGMPAPKIFKEVSDDIKKGVDYVVQYRQNDLVPSPPSTIIRWHDGNIEIVRP